MPFFSLFSRKSSGQSSRSGMQSSSHRSKRDAEKRIRSIVDTIGRLEDRG